MDIGHNFKANPLQDLLTLLASNDRDRVTGSDGYSLARRCPAEKKGAPLQRVRPAGSLRKALPAKPRDVR